MPRCNHLAVPNMFFYTQKMFFFFWCAKNLVVEICTRLNRHRSTKRIASRHCSDDPRCIASFFIMASTHVGNSTYVKGEELCINTINENKEITNTLGKILCRSNNCPERDSNPQHFGDSVLTSLLSQWSLFLDSTVYIRYTVRADNIV